MRIYLSKLMKGEHLTVDEMIACSDKIFSGEATESEVGALLGLLALKGETAEEITGLVQSIRARSIPFTQLEGNIMDNCGTGGDGSKSFNVSTTSAFVIAGAGITVAKHGNRSVSSQTGSADVLEQLGVGINHTPKEITSLLAENGIAFLFAQSVHPAMKAVMKVRKDLGVPTIFNMIGPLTNPVDLETQLMGIYRRDKLQVMGDVLKQLGRKRAVIVNGAHHMDEASLAGENHVVVLENGALKELILKPEDVGLPTYSLDEIIGGDAERNARIILSVLRGDDGPFRDTVLLNAGLGIYAHGKANTIKEGIARAKESIDSGAALNKLNFLIKYNEKLKEQGVV